MSETKVSSRVAREEFYQRVKRLYRWRRRWGNLRHAANAVVHYGSKRSDSVDGTAVAVRDKIQARVDSVDEQLRNESSAWWVYLSKEDGWTE